MCADSVTITAAKDSYIMDAGSMTVNGTVYLDMPMNHFGWKVIVTVKGHQQLPPLGVIPTAPTFRWQESQSWTVNGSLNIDSAAAGSPFLTGSSQGHQWQNCKPTPGIDCTSTLTCTILDFPSFNPFGGQVGSLVVNGSAYNGIVFSITITVTYTSDPRCACKNASATASGTGLEVWTGSFAGNPNYPDYATVDPDPWNWT